MCRSIKKLRDPEQFPSDEEIRAAALQYIRKVSGYRKPSRRNESAFNRAIADVATSTQRLLEQLEPAQHQK
jgi:hypothetical protein